MKTDRARLLGLGRITTAVILASAVCVASEVQSKPGDYTCAPANYDVVIVPTGGKIMPIFSSKIDENGRALKIATFTPLDGEYLIGTDVIAATVADEVIVDDSKGTKGIFVDDKVGQFQKLIMTGPGQTIILMTAGEVVLAGDIALSIDQSLRIYAKGIDAIDCQVIPGQGNGADIEGGRVSLHVGNGGIGTSSLPYGQVVANHVGAFALDSAVDSRVCLNMMSTGGDTSAMRLGKINIGGQTGIRLNGQPLYATRNFLFKGAGASLLIGNNASLCY